MVMRSALQGKEPPQQSPRPRIGPPRNGIPLSWFEIGELLNGTVAYFCRMLYLSSRRYDLI